MKIVDDLKALPPAWLGAIAGAAAAGAALFPEHRLIAGAAAAGLVFYIARKATQPCCASCADAAGSASSGTASTQQEQVADANMRSVAIAPGELFADGTSEVTTSGAAAGGDLFPDSPAAAVDASLFCTSCTKEQAAPAASLASSSEPTAPIFTAPAPEPVLATKTTASTPVVSLATLSYEPSPIETTTLYQSQTSSRTAFLGKAA